MRIKFIILGILAVCIIFFFQSSVQAKSKKLINLKIGQTSTFDVVDGKGNSWEHDASVSGRAIIRYPKKRNYFTLDIFGYEDPDTGPHVKMLRSTNNKVYMYEGFGEELLVFKKGPVGTTWTYTESDGDIIRAKIVKKETVVVPAGTFNGCLKFKKKCTNCNSNRTVWYEWIKPGFGMVMQRDYWTNNAPKTYKLKSY
jgi:hypothetical protein